VFKIHDAGVKQTSYTHKSTEKHYVHDEKQRTTKTPNLATGGPTSSQEKH
jgi:hypothetical protein